jgi:ABC-2 type transport system ATP-binding protein
MTAALNIQDVKKSFADKAGASVQALRGVSFQVQPGEFFGLLGPNGAGKTTLISIIAGLSRATSGKVSVMGNDVVTDFRKARLALGIVPQELVFDPFFTVRETLRWQSGYFGIKNNDAWIDEILGNLDLTSKANANMRSLSGGMKRRVLVAQALVHRPPVIVLDEPTAGVDVELRQTLWRFVQRLNQQGHTIVLTTHYLEEAQELCDRIAMLKLGQLVALDKTSNLLKTFAGARVGFKLSSIANGQSPVSALSSVWQARVVDTERTNQTGRFELRVDNYAQVELLLAHLREAGHQLEELEVGHADLEDVFIKTMQGAQA